MEALPDAELGPLRRRSTRTLFISVSFAAIAFYAAFTSGVLVAAELTDSASWNGVPGAAAILGAGLGAGLLSRLMAVRGRRPGLVLGYGFAMVGAATATLAFNAGLFGLFLVGMVLIGFGLGASQLSRFVAADLQPLARRGSALAWIVWSSMLGAAAGPALLAPMRGPAESLGLPPLAGAFVMAGVSYLIAALLCALLLRPDPSTLAYQEPLVENTVTEHPGDSIWRLPQVRTALIVLLATQAAMVLIMTMTPIHIRASGHALDSIGLVMSSHFVGMFALAPLAGKLVDRVGKELVTMLGLGLLLAAAAVAALVPRSAHMVLLVPLFLLGLGWSLAFVAGSSMLSSGLTYAQRVRAQGNVDTAMWTAGATASLLSGILLDALSYAALCVIGGAIVVVAAGVVAPRLARRPDASAATG